MVEAQQRMEQAAHKAAVAGHREAGMGAGAGAHCAGGAEQECRRECHCRMGPAQEMHVGGLHRGASGGVKGQKKGQKKGPKHQTMGWCTVTSLLPSGKVASTCMSGIISAMPSITSARLSRVRPVLISSATVLPSRAPSMMAAL